MTTDVPHFCYDHLETANYDGKKGTMGTYSTLFMGTGSCKQNAKASFCDEDVDVMCEDTGHIHFSQKSSTLT